MAIICTTGRGGFAILKEQNKLKTINIVWAAGNEGYHIKRGLRDYRSSRCLVHKPSNYKTPVWHQPDAMRRAVEIVVYHRQVQTGATISKAAHLKLQQQATMQGCMKLA